MTKLRGYQNKEAELRLKSLRLPEDIVLCSSKGQKRRCGKAELYSLKDIEKKYDVVVYHIILTQNKELPGTFDDRSEYAYLCVSKDESNWENEREQLRLGSIDAILENEKEGIREGKISYKKDAKGGFVRMPYIEITQDDEGSASSY
jgi:hypothetical protein